MSSANRKKNTRKRRALRSRSKIFGTPERPRLSVYRSNRAIYGQLIDDVGNHTVAAAGTPHVTEDGLAPKEEASKVGEVLAERAKAAGISKVVFDKGPYRYHGRVKALADGARGGGLDF